jgi:hypothetical protein
MVWVISLSRTDLSTRALTPGYRVMAFGVCPGLVGDEAP